MCVKTVGTDFSGNIHRKCPILFPDFFLPDRMTTNHCQITWSTSFKTRWYYWIDACSTIAGEQIWRSRQNCGAVQIATNRRNFLKLINTVLISSFIHQIRFETCLFAIKWLSKAFAAIAASSAGVHWSNLRCQILVTFLNVVWTNTIKSQRLICPDWYASNV